MSPLRPLDFVRQKPKTPTQNSSQFRVTRSAGGLRRLRVNGKARDADRHAHLHFFCARTVRMQPTEVRLRDARTRPLRAHDSARLFRIGKHNAKLITPIARNEIGRIRSGRAQQNRKLPQKRIPASMPEIVIPAFKAVDKFQARTESR